jgi:hypothetical protein
MSESDISESGRTAERLLLGLALLTLGLIALLTPCCRVVLRRACADCRGPPPPPPAAAPVDVPRESMGAMAIYGV